MNGRLFLNTDEEKHIIMHENGVCSINLFYYDIEAHYHDIRLSWHGLCGTRILQVLKHYSILSKSVLRKSLSSGFGYNETVLDSTINRLTYYGMIDVQCFHKDTTLRITNKGMGFFFNTYSDIVSSILFCFRHTITQKFSY